MVEFYSYLFVILSSPILYYFSHYIYQIISHFISHVILIFGG